MNWVAGRATVSIAFTIFQCFFHCPEITAPHSYTKTREDFHGVVLSLEKIVRDSRQLVKGGSVQPTKKQLKQRTGVNPTLADCLDGLGLLEEMHQYEYHLKLSVVSVLHALALKPRGSDDLGALQQLLADQRNVPKGEVQDM